MGGDSGLRFLDGGGDMGAAIRAHDWSATPLGPVADWSAALKVVVGMMVNSRFPKCLFWGPDLISIYNDAYRPMLGDKPVALGRPMAEVWSDVFEEIAPIARKALAGEATFIEDFPLDTDRHGYTERAYFTFCYSPVRDEAGLVVGVMDTVIETTAKVEAERNSKLLNAELAHRIRNTFAMVSAIAAQTLRTSATKEDAQKKLTQRIAALGNAHGLLTRTAWTGASVGEVVEEALKPHRSGEGRIRVEGPHVALPSRQALALALAIHELATNAVKYGALSCEQGRVDVAWSVGGPDAAGRFRFAWTESGGPRVSPPTRRGFGSRLVEQALAGDFGGAVTIDHDPSGLRCRLVADLRDLKAEPAAPPAHADDREVTEVEAQ